jgi:PAS domain-containing protein
VVNEAPSHGIDRFVQKHSLLDLFEEVRILRSVIIIELATEMQRSLNIGEAATFHAIFDIIIQQSVMTYVEKQTDPLRRSEETAREMNAQLLATAVRHDELLGQESEATRTLQQISTELIQQEDPASLYERVLDGAITIMHSDMASMQSVDERRDALQMLAVRGFGPEFANGFEWNGSDAVTSCNVARRSGQRVIVPDVETCDFIAGTPALEDYRKTGIRAVQSKPLLSRSGHVIGVISTYWRRPHTPAENDLRRLDILARQAADLIERKQGEEVKSRLASIVASSDDAIISMDLDGIITTWNQGAQHLFGYTGKEVIGKPVSLLIPEGRLDEKPGILDRIRRGESVEHYETMRRRKD